MNGLPFSSCAGSDAASGAASRGGASNAGGADSSMLGGGFREASPDSPTRESWVALATSGTPTPTTLLNFGRWLWRFLP